MNILFWLTMFFSCLSVSPPQPCDPRLWNGLALLLTPSCAHHISMETACQTLLGCRFWRPLICSLSPAQISLNKPGFLVGAYVRSSLLSSQWGLELSFSLLWSTPRESSMSLSCPELPPLIFRPMAGFLPWVPASTCTCHLPPESFLLPYLPATYQNWKPFWVLQAPPRSVGAIYFVSLKFIFLCIPITSARVQAHIISCFSYYNSNPILLPPCLLSLHPISKFQPTRKLP